MQALSQNSSIRGYITPMPQGRPSKRKRSIFGQRLFDFRETAGLTQGDLSKKLGISQRTYSEWERGSVAIHPERLQELATLLGITASELLGEARSRKSHLPSNSRLGENIKALAKLPRRKQAKILDVVEAMLAQEAKAS